MTNNVFASTIHTDTFDIDETIGEYPVSNFYNCEGQNPDDFKVTNTGTDFSAPNCIEYDIGQTEEHHINFTTNKQIEKISWAQRFDSILDNAVFNIRFRDSSGTDVYILKFEYDNPNYEFRNGNNDVLLGTISSPLLYSYFNVTFNSSTGLWFEYRRISDGLVQLNAEDTTIDGRSLSTVSSLFFEVLTTDSGEKIFIDNLEVTFSDAILGEEPPEYEFQFEVNLYDYATGNELLYVPVDYTGYVHLAYDYVRCTITSDLWSGDYFYSSNPKDNPLQFAVETTQGSYHRINFSWCFGEVEDETTYWQNYSLYNQIYSGQTFNVYLVDQDYGDDLGWFHCAGSKPVWCGLTPRLCTDKGLYDDGEQVLIRYQMPTFQELYDCPYVDGNEYYLWIYDRADLNPLTQRPDDGISAKKSVSLGVEGGQPHTITFSKSDYGTLSGGYDEYRIYLGAHIGGSFWTWGQTYWMKELDFTIFEGGFNPQGNFTSVSPDPAHIGQKFNITYEANNNGKITYKNLFDPDAEEKQLTSFSKPLSGSGYIASKSFSQFGSYWLTLYVEGHYGNMTEVDNYLLNVNTTNESYGNFGYNAEFLVCEPERAIAGYDHLKIHYKTMKDTEPTLITVTDPRNQRTTLSTTVTKGYGTFETFLEDTFPIGEWTITMYGNDTLNTTFYTVATENNWIMFAKNEYTTDDIFNIELKHDVKVKVKILYDDIEIGQDWFLEQDVLNFGVYEVPIQYARPQYIGLYTVELWQVNDFVEKKLLATDYCNVIMPIVDDDYTLSDDPDASIVQHPVLKLVAGLLIIMVLTILPLGAGRFIKDIPNFIYGAFMSFGLVVNVALSLWEFWTLIAIAMIMVLLIVFEYVKSKRQ